MSRRVKENVVALLIAGVFVYVIAACIDFGPRARLVPLPVAVFGLVLTLVQLVWQNVRSTDELQVDLLRAMTGSGEVKDPAAFEHAQAAPAKSRPAWQNEALALGIVALMLLLTLALGPIPAVLIFTGGYFIVTGHYSLLKSLVYTAVFTAAIYALFVLALEVQLYHGLLEPIVQHFQ